MAGITLGSKDVNITLGNTPIVEISLGSVRLYPISTDAVVSPTTINLGSGATSATLSVSDNSSHGWTLVSNGWATVSQGSGIGNAVVTVSASANPQASGRSTTLTFRDTTTQVATSVSVVQDAAAPATQLTLVINSGTWTCQYNNAMEMQWAVFNDRDGYDTLYAFWDASPRYYGSTYNWGFEDEFYDYYSEVIPSSDFGTTRTVWYELVINDDNGNYLTHYSGSASVQIPQNPSISQQVVYLNLPTL